MVSLENNILSLENNMLSDVDLSLVRESVFLNFKTKKQILDNLVAQENMKKWLLHYIAIAQNKSNDSVDVEVWPEDVQTIV